MRRYNYYEVEVKLYRRAGGIERHFLRIGALNRNTAMEKAMKRLRQCPHGISVSQWELTGQCRQEGYIFV